MQWTLSYRDFSIQKQSLTARGLSMKRLLGLLAFSA